MLGLSLTVAMSAGPDPVPAAWQLCGMWRWEKIKITLLWVLLDCNHKLYTLIFGHPSHSGLKRRNKSPQALCPAFILQFLNHPSHSPCSRLSQTDQIWHSSAPSGRAFQRVHVPISITKEWFVSSWESFSSLFQHHLPYYPDLQTVAYDFTPLFGTTVPQIYNFLVIIFQMWLSIAEKLSQTFM